MTVCPSCGESLERGYVVSIDVTLRRYYRVPATTQSAALSAAREEFPAFRDWFSKEQDEAAGQYEFLSERVLRRGAPASSMDCTRMMSAMEREA